MTEERIIKVIASHLEMEESEITEATTFEDLGVDSLDAVEIMMELEDEFGVEVKAEEAGKSVKELADYLNAKLG
ncbi:MAG: acyl carrier protein [Oscillospiraceae bacterium]